MRGGDGGRNGRIRNDDIDDRISPVISQYSKLEVPPTKHHIQLLKPVTFISRKGISPLSPVNAWKYVPGNVSVNPSGRFFA